jgi:hypothetical protein
MQSSRFGQSPKVESNAQRGLPIKRLPQKQKTKINGPLPQKDITVPAHWRVVNSEGKVLAKT